MQKNGDMWAGLFFLFLGLPSSLDHSECPWNAFRPPARLFFPCWPGFSFGAVGRPSHSCFP